MNTKTDRLVIALAVTTAISASVMLIVMVMKKPSSGVLTPEDYSKTTQTFTATIASTTTLQFQTKAELDKFLKSKNPEVQMLRTLMAATSSDSKI